MSARFDNDLLALASTAAMHAVLEILIGQNRGVESNLESLRPLSGPLHSQGEG